MLICFGIPLQCNFRLYWAYNFDTLSSKSHALVALQKPSLCLRAAVGGPAEEEGASVLTVEALSTLPAVPGPPTTRGLCRVCLQSTAWKRNDHGKKLQHLRVSHCILMTYTVLKVKGVQTNNVMHYHTYPCTDTQQKISVCDVSVSESWMPFWIWYMI